LSFNFFFGFVRAAFGIEGTIDSDGTESGIPIEWILKTDKGVEIFEMAIRAVQ
jgi:hypothetical protein